MSTCNLVQFISGSECIGASRPKINNNFAVLESVSCNLSTFATNLSGDIEILYQCCDEVRTAISSVARTLAQIRISPSSIEPVVLEDYNNVTTIYIHPYSGNSVGIYNTSTSRWEAIQIPSVLSYSLSSLAANTNYNVFLDYDGTNFDLEFVSWSTSFASPTAGVPFPSAGVDYVYQDGIRVRNSGTYYGRFIGCIRTTDIAGETELSFGRKWIDNGSHPKFYIWNAQNQIPATFGIYDGSGDWTVPSLLHTANSNGPLGNFGYRSATSTNNGAGNRISFITGDTQEVEMHQDHYTSGTWAYLTHGLNLEQGGTPNPFVRHLHQQGQIVSENQGQTTHNSKFMVPAGFHFIQELVMSYGSTKWMVYEGPTSGGSAQFPGGRHTYGTVGKIAKF